MGSLPLLGVPTRSTLRNHETTISPVRDRVRARPAKERSMSLSAQRRRLIVKLTGAVVALVVVVAAVASTRVLSIDQAAEASQAGAFEPADYAAEHFDEDIVPIITDDAVDLSTLLADLAGGADEAEFGNSPGASSAYSFPVTFTGVAGQPNGSILPVTVDGVPEGTVVQLQIGPAINGTAIRDATGTVKFNDFTNQLEFQEVATELNTLVRDQVLVDVDPASIAGQTVTVTGAFTRVNPALVSVVPVSLEVAE
jgi:predicted lipoprotein